ncbi:MAG: hypothetical protein P0S96_04985 [Simkaniaceae bacterium]|nr:hypothetical protein [Candidatus Sacchlamyda saccharinae]
MKKWIAEALALLLSVSTQTGLYGADVAQPQTGKEIIQHAEKAYSRGDYSTFLEQMHEQYQNAGKAGALRGIFESAKSAMNITPEQIEKTKDKYRTEIKKLNQQRNQKLLDAIAENPSLAIVQRVDSIAFFSQSDEESKLLSELENLKFHIPETAEGTIDNIISSLETEYYIKNLLLDASNHISKTSTDQTEKRVALALEKLSKMERAAKEKSDKNWEEKIQKVRTAFLADRAYRMDLATLNDLAEGKVAAENSIEEKVKQIMMEYQQQKQQILPTEIVNR